MFKGPSVLHKDPICSTARIGTAVGCGPDDMPLSRRSNLTGSAPFPDETWSRARGSMDENTMMTSDHTPPTDAMHKIARACTDPLWIQHRLLATGHGATTDNGTATFIKFEGRHYMCTCAHVVEAAKGDNIPALMIDRLVLNCADYQDAPSGTPVYKHIFRIPDRQRFDIAIAPIDFHWDLLRTKKGKSAIDLDTWRNVSWAQDCCYLAAGYPTEHKYSVEEKLAVSMLLVAAEPASTMSPGSTSFSLHSTVGAPHGYFFSGLSGGPIFLPETADILVPIGIVIEGGPSSSTAPESFMSDDNTIFIRGQTLTPTLFREWLGMTDLGRHLS